MIKLTNLIVSYFNNKLITMAGNFFRGTTVEQDGRWGSSDDKLIKKLTKAGRFDPILNESIDISKINLDVITRWIHEKLLDVLGFEDEVVSGLVINMIQQEV